MSIGLNYPCLSSLIDISKLPDSLYFLHGGLSTFLDNLYYRNFQITHNATGDQFSVRIEILINKDLSAEIPGTGGFELLINPDYAGTTMTVIPLFFNFSWGVLRYVKSFDPTTFTYTGTNVFSMFEKITNFSDSDLLTQALGQILLPGTSDSLTTFAQHVNTAYGTSITIPLSSDFDTAINAVVTAVQGSSSSMSGILYNDYLKDSLSDAKTIINISKLYSGITPNDPFNFIRKLITPIFRAGVKLSAGIAIPRTILLPMLYNTSAGEWQVDNTLVGGVLPKSTLILNIGTITFDSARGDFGFQDNITLNFQSPHTKAQIAGTSLTIQFTNAHLSLTSKSGSGSTVQYHKIVTIDSVTIGLPNIFNQTNGGTSGPYIKGTNIVIDSDTGFSGTIALQPGTGGTDPSILEYSFVNGLQVSLTSFDVTFVHGSITASHIVGTMTIPGLSGNPFGISIGLLPNGFEIDITSTSGITIVSTSDILIKLNSLLLGRTGTVWKFGFAASFQNNYDIPAINKVFPQKFIVHNFVYKSDNSDTEFDIEAQWESGATMRGNQTTGLQAYFPIGATDPIILNGIQLNATATGGLDIKAMLVGAGLNVGIGKGIVDGLGMDLKISNDPTGTGFGHIGPFKTDISIIGPQGIGVQIKGPEIDGGGYLYLNQDKGLYYGAFQLKIADEIGISVVAIITSKNTDGTPGFSLLVIANVTFDPGIPIGFGFNINGIGGVVGIHRDFNSIPIRDGMKNGSINDIMFPDIDIAKVDKLINNLQTYFPANQDRYTFGIFFLIDWGMVDPIIQIKLGIIINIPNPVRLAILGNIEIALPTPDDPLLELNIAFIGIIDFDNKYMMFDATIYNSHLLTFSLSGDMAVRMFWGDNKEMVLSVGGFHPAYNPPSYLQLPAKMNRLTISIFDTDSLKLKFTTYFAITSNTLQFGSEIDFLLKVWKVSVVGYFGFDVLFQLNPFHFIADIKAGLAVKLGSRELMSISMNITLDGPGLWHAKGSARFKVLFVKKTANLNKTWGSSTNTTLPGVTIKPMILASLNDTKNWKAELPADKNLLTNMRPLPPGTTDIVLHPLGSLTVGQNVVPLGLSVERFGSQKPTDGGTYDITNIKIATISQPNLNAINTNFAPSQFKNMSDDQKLKAASFEFLKSGSSATSANNDWSAHLFIVKNVQYNTIVIDQLVRWPTWGSPKAHTLLEKRVVNNFAKGGIVSANPLSVRANARIAKPIYNVTLKQEEYKLVSIDSLASVGTSVLTAPLSIVLDAVSSAGPLSSALTSSVL